MLWGCITWPRLGAIVQVIRRMTAKQYIIILNENLLRSLEAAYLLGGMPSADQLIFLQDNDLKYTTRALIAYLVSKGINRLGCPAQSLDFNPIEHSSSEIKRKLGQYT